MTQIPDDIMQTARQILACPEIVFKVDMGGQDRLTVAVAEAILSERQRSRDWWIAGRDAAAKEAKGLWLQCDYESIADADVLNELDEFTQCRIRAIEPPAEIADTRFDLVAHLHHQRDFSLRTFGPGSRTKGVIDHIRKEFAEIEADPTDIKEWVDVIILAFDGAWRAGWEPDDIVQAIVAKQAKNEARTWPDWRTADPDKAIEHDRSKDAQAAAPPTAFLKQAYAEYVEATGKNADLEHLQREGQKWDLEIELDRLRTQLAEHKALLREANAHVEYVADGEAGSNEGLEARSLAARIAALEPPTEIADTRTEADFVAAPIDEQGYVDFSKSPDAFSMRSRSSDSATN